VDLPIEKQAAPSHFLPGVPGRLGEQRPSIEEEWKFAITSILMTKVFVV
jgi:hypothetical protein